MPSRKKAPRAWVPKLAPRWERIGRVRGRFRRNQPWLKLAKGPENHEIVQCTPSIGANYEILASVLEIHGLKLQKVDYLAKEEGIVKSI